ncbi:hypothetical protein BP422_24820 [Brevibacillus formosus]|uniref:SLH domain-containing protein n=1 Tax=Brevibacillus formosus TaxID=54913 RepID=A0A220MNG4_9BACL|nr:S-layer homology domain-containing protein [Brevibacillus formosus]ASJ56502.1 hypothetical protein BP422_24820 [Brevibacillus formosus]
MLSNGINLRKIGMVFLIFSLVFTGMGASLGTPVSYAAEEETYYVSSSGDDTTGDGTRDLPFATLYTAYQKIGSAGTIYVLDNINLLASTTKKYDKNKVVTITTAPGVGETAVIQRDPAGDGTLLDLSLGQLTLKNIIIDGSYQGGKMAQGRIINVYDAKLIIEEGTVLRNSYSNFPGSAIYLGQSTAVLQMTGGVITGNKNNSTGAVYLGAGTFNMTGGQITNNSGGGVDLQAGKFALSGDATITGNTIVVSGQPKARNVNLQGSTLLTLSGEFTGKAGITAQNRMTAGSKFGQADAGELSGLENLIADDSPLFAVYGASNDLLWKAPPTVTFEQPSGDKVSTGKPEFKGTSTAGSKLTVEIKDKAGNVVDTPTVTVDAEGNWTFTPTKDLEDGEYAVEVTATTDEGKSAKATKSITVDTTPTEPVVDKSKLQAKAEQIRSENLKAEDYTTESWGELQKALQKADEVLNDPNATQEAVDAALAALVTAYEGLDKVSTGVDKSKLQAKAEQIKSENLKADDYTTESWEELQNALQKADAVLADPNATQQEVDEALLALTKAREGLKKPSVPTPTVDKSKLQAKADEIQSENLAGEDYTSERWEELQKALEKADAVLADQNATQEEVDKALSALTKTREGLQKPDEPTPTVDKSKLQARVDEIDDEDLDEDDYTSSSWRKLEKALERANDVLEDPDATQDEVDEALAELKKARRGLESADKRDRDRDKERKKDRESTNQVQNPFFTGGGSGYVEPKPSEPAKEENDQTGYMNGYPTGNFDPNRQVTRAEMAMILVNTGMVKTTSASGMFMDVADQHWAADAIRRANEAGLMNGYSNGTFNPGGGITRAEMATIVYKHLGLNGDDMPNNFYDVPADNWATQIIAAVSKEGYIAGYPDGTFHPQKTLTRAETVTIINRLLNHSQLSTVIGQSWPDVPPTHWAYKDIEAATKK